ncbi:MAG: AMP-dependent synthetase [Chloroflexi bacterium]|nr:AMP-dependent synthetase [Chloroflexota bacterium]
MTENSTQSDNAIIIPDGPTLSYEELNNEIERLASILTNIGLTKGTTASIVFENGLEFISIFLAISKTGATVAPLNPEYTIDEFKFYMNDTDSKFLILSSKSNASINAANQLSIQIINVSMGNSGTLSLYKDNVQLTKQKIIIPPEPDDIALFLHTSGTTSQPKGVPLTHLNLMTSLSNISSSYNLTNEDTALLVMPLFHVHGLIGVSLSTLFSGGTLVIPPKFSASTFWNHQNIHEATWYSAVPTIHQILLMRAEKDNAPKKSFRFIRSCSAALAPSVFKDLETRFGAPVLEAYGMTEASHQMSSNLLPPFDRSPGTVGQGTGVEISIMNEFGTLLNPNNPGEVVIKGENVTLGYHNNPSANAEAFTNGWFRTGDQGEISNSGILTLTGRLKELINRGGEKISPLEVDATLIKHPNIVEAVCFGASDIKYGEVVHAAIVTSESISASEIQSFCSDHIADFKIPSKIYIVDQLPRTATGKIQRRNIAKQFNNS